jgi:hypothetical protein
VLPRTLLLTLLATTLTGCFDAINTSEYDMRIVEEKYPVRQDASPACVSAAKRASHWCIGYARATLDPMSGTECNNAQWDYARNCR